MERRDGMDPLEWTHQWDHYEMMMYVDNEGDDPGIYMQVSTKVRREGAEEWSILYDRRLSDVPVVENPHEPGTIEWEDVILRQHLHQNPHLVNDEKEYLQGFLNEQVK